MKSANKLFTDWGLNPSPSAGHVSVLLLSHPTKTIFSQKFINFDCAKILWYQYYFYFTGHTVMGAVAK